MRAAVQTSGIKAQRLEPFKATHSTCDLSFFSQIQSSRTSRNPLRSQMTPRLAETTGLLFSSRSIGFGGLFGKKTRLSQFCCSTICLTALMHCSRAICPTYAPLRNQQLFCCPVFALRVRALCMHADVRFRL